MVVLLIAYFAGFASGIYVLVPVEGEQQGEKGFAASVFKSDDFARSLSGRMHECVDSGKEMWRVANKYMSSERDNEQARDG